MTGIKSTWGQCILNACGSNFQTVRGIYCLAFYRPQSADSVYHSSAEDYLNLAIDTGKQDIIVTGDF